MDKITGRARYTTDVRLEDQWEGVIIRSTLAHARIGTVAHAEARLVDLLGPDRTVRYVGQPVAALAAPTLAEARAAARAVEVGYQPLPAVLDAEQALRPGAPAVHGDKEARKAAPRSNEAPLGPAALARQPPRPRLVQLARRHRRPPDRRRPGRR